MPSDRAVTLAAQWDTEAALITGGETVAAGHRHNQADIDDLLLALQSRLSTAQLGQPLGAAPLDANAKVPAINLPDISTTRGVFPVSSQAAMLGLNAQIGAVAVRSDLNGQSYILAALPASSLSNWLSQSPPGTVTSVNGQTGVVTIPGYEVATPSVNGLVPSGAQDGQVLRRVGGVIVWANPEIWTVRTGNATLGVNEACAANSGVTELTLPTTASGGHEILNNTTAAITVWRGGTATISGIARSTGAAIAATDRVRILPGQRGLFVASGGNWIAQGCEAFLLSLVEYAATLAQSSLTTLPFLGGGTAPTATTLAAEVTVLSGNQTIATNTNWGSATPDDRYTFVRCEGNLTINSGVTVTALARKLGLVLYVTGTLTVNGTLTMTARGANHSSGGSNLPAMDILAISAQLSSSARIIPAIGSSDRVKAFASVNAAGDTGNAGSNGGTGGGGTGGGYDGSSTGRGGTCFGGGPGGGAVYASADGNLNSAGLSNGGAGGNGSNVSGQDHGGGAGNPGGLQDRGLGGASTFDGGAGTGGVLIVYAAGGVVIGSTGVVSSNGVQAHTGTATRGGGGSGGGIVRIFGSSVTNNGTVQVNGGVGGPSNGGAPGAAGGPGSFVLEVV